MGREEELGKKRRGLFIPNFAIMSEKSTLLRPGMIFVLFKQTLNVIKQVKSSGPLQPVSCHQPA